MMQKYTIFTKHHNVCITNEALEFIETNKKQLIECDADNYNKINLSSLLKEAEDKMSVIVHVNDLDVSKVFVEAIKKNHFVQAAGGIVRNKNNDILFIFRNGKWDLPKGHKEINEELDATAIREVEEECGLNDLVLGDKVGITYHTYILNKVEQIKETHWYQMRTESDTLIPQKEEGIEKAEWIGLDRLSEIKNKTYPSLKDLLDNIKL